MIKARLDEGYTVDDFKTVIDKKVKAWKDDPKMSAYLRPETLFRPSHFESYLNEIETGRASPVKSEKPKGAFYEFPKNNYDFAALEAEVFGNG